MLNILKLLATETIEKIDAASVGIPTGTADATIGGVLNLVYFIAGLIAVLVIVFAGYTFATSSSNPGAIKNAKNMILYAVIGLVVVILAFVITQFIIGRF